MNEELKNQLAELLRKAIETAEKTGEFVLDQAPDLLNEFYAWETTKAIILLVFGVLLMFGLWGFTRLGRPSKPKEEYGRFKFMGRWFIFDEIIPLGAALGVISMGIGLSTTTFQILKLVKLAIAPKIYLIEYFLK